MLPRFALFSRFLISNTISRNVKFSIKPACALQSKCCYTFSLLYQPNRFNILHERLEQLNISTIQSRAKSSNRRNSEYESDSDSDDELQQIPGSKIVQVQSVSFRCDMILKQGLGLSRNKLEVQFYEGRIRINGMKAPKKSTDVQVGDEIDLIRGISEDNPHFIIVSRLEVLKARPTGDMIILTLRKHKSLLIENYESHPWVETPSEKSGHEE